MDEVNIDSVLEEHGVRYAESIEVEIQAERNALDADATEPTMSPAQSLMSSATRVQPSLQMVIPHRTTRFAIITIVTIIAAYYILLPLFSIL